jgi:hypothetical protein
MNEKISSGRFIIITFWKSQLGARGYAYNPSYSRGRDKKDHDSKPAWVKRETLSQKYPTFQKGW